MANLYAASGESEQQQEESKEAAATGFQYCVRTSARRLLRALGDGDGDGDETGTDRVTETEHALDDMESLERRVLSRLHALASLPDAGAGAETETLDVDLLGLVGMSFDAYAKFLYDILPS